jgi:hypothetical protein
MALLPFPVGIQLGMERLQGRERGSCAGKTLLVETHGEHIMLRLLRRIRETTEYELAEETQTRLVWSSTSKGFSSKN